MVRISLIVEESGIYQQSCCGTSRRVTARLIDGKAVAQQIESEVASTIAGIGYAPGLVAVRVGNDPA
jgi:hypothetical protein